MHNSFLTKCHLEHYSTEATICSRAIFQFEYKKNCPRTYTVITPIKNANPSLSQHIFYRSNCILREFSGATPPIHCLHPTYSKVIIKLSTPGLKFFFKIGVPKWPMEQKMVGHFLKWSWAQAYQTNHSWHLGSILYLHTDTDTCMHIWLLTADHTVKPVLSGHSKKKTNYRLMQVKSIAKCSKGSILQSFQPLLSYHLLLRSLFCLFLSGCIRHVLLYWQSTCTFCFVECIDSL